MLGFYVLQDFRVWHLNTLPKGAKEVFSDPHSEASKSLAHKILNFQRLLDV